MFEKQYDDHDFLKVLDKEVPKSASGIAKIIGCAPSTAKRTMKRLEDSHLVRSMEIDIGAKYITVWVLGDDSSAKSN